MTGNSCHEITVAVNTPSAIYLRILSGLTRILRVNRRNTPKPPAETCHSYYDTGHPDLAWKRKEKERERTRKKKLRPQKRGSFAKGIHGRTCPLKSYFHRELYDLPAPSPIDE